jgi:hypothetical protein
MLTVNPTFIDMYRGDTQKFDVTPGQLDGGFVIGTDVVKFTAKKAWTDAVPVIAITSPTDIIIQSTANTRVVIQPALTASLPFETVELHFGVEVVRSGTEKYTLLSGTMIVKPVVRQ